MNKLVVILGPTSSGKSSLAIKLARKFKGEIVSADSRQVYRDLDIGTGKVSKQEQRLVPHHLLDVASPKKQFTVADFKPLALRAIGKIQGKNKLPFLVGGTPFYIYATIDDLQIPEVKPNIKLRKLYERKSPAELFKVLQELDPKRSKTIDRHNPVRLIRAIEIAKTMGSVPPLKRHPELVSGSKPLIIGIKKNLNQLYKLIDLRLKKRLRQGLIAEVKKLRKNGMTWKRLREFGLEYRFVALYLQNKMNYADMVAQLQSVNHKFAKRQMTWFKTDKRIHWIRSAKQAEKLIRDYLHK